MEFLIENKTFTHSQTFFYNKFEKEKNVYSNQHDAAGGQINLWTNTHKLTRYKETYKNWYFFAKTQKDTKFNFSNIHRGGDHERKKEGKENRKIKHLNIIKQQFQI